MISHRLRLLALAALGVSLSACPDVPEECRSNVDCPSGQGCRDELCVPLEDVVPDGGAPPAGDAGDEGDAGPVDLDGGPGEPDAGATEDAGAGELDAGLDEIEDAGDSDAGTDAGDAG